MPTVELTGRGTVAYHWTGNGPQTVVLLNGTADSTTPVPMSRELAQLLPGADLVEFEGVTHMGPMLLKKEAEPVFERYLAFMEEVLNSRDGSGNQIGKELN